MSKQSEKVQKWRNNCKDRIVAAFDGKCCICGYYKSNRALALHHLDPSKKDFSISDIRANPKNWSAIVNELLKCVLVCSNCHHEIHEGSAIVPIDAPTFDKSFENYKIVVEKISTPCLVCGELKPSHMKYCSNSCSAKSKYKVDWDNVNLEEELKTKSILKLSEEIGCSDGAIHKRLKKLGLK